MPAYVAPWMLWLGGLAEPERGYLRGLLGALDRNRYAHIAEPAAGMLAVSLLARDLGWPASQLVASDVTFVPTVAGFVAAGRDLTELDVHLDEEPLPIDGAPVEAGAQLCYEFSLAKTRAAQEKTPSEYLAGMIDDLEERADWHRQAILTALGAMAAPLSGMRFDARCLFEHTAEASADEHTVVVLNPPSYRGGYEKLADTGGRITWREPTYELFDPVDGVRRLLSDTSDSPALVLVRTEDRDAIAEGDQIVYARYLGQGRHVFYAANRPDEIRAAVGNQVGSSTGGKAEQPKFALLPPDHEITSESTIGVQQLTPSEARYLKDLWMHRPTSAQATVVWALIVDGFVAAVAGYDSNTLVRPFNPAGSWRFRDSALLMFTFAAPHRRRILRLLSKVALQRFALELLASPKLAMHVTAARRVITVDETAKPESKSKRGLMELVERRPDKDHPGQFRLFYVADIEELTPAEVLAWWLADEDRHDAPQKPGRRKRREPAA